MSYLTLLINSTLSSQQYFSFFSKFLNTNMAQYQLVNLYPNNPYIVENTHIYRILTISISISYNSYILPILTTVQIYS